MDRLLWAGGRAVRCVSFQGDRNVLKMGLGDGRTSLRLCWEPPAHSEFHRIQGAMCCM